ncbi:hypothetical protein ABH931_004714 [Streptacidiphilus sp. MAP12-33]|uniref:SSI family serine proteinase inhibitor n=1 Tax=Streptacidiphilus sp. MAP12-33 TaxID=3156266 RepID=UPI0035124B87
MASDNRAEWHGPAGGSIGSASPRAGAALWQGPGTERPDRSIGHGASPEDTMRPLPRRTAAFTLAAVAALLAGAAPRAAADPVAPGASSTAPGPSVLVMTVGAGTAVDPGPSRSTVLTCDDDTPGGDHPSPAESCAALRSDGLDFTSRPTLQVMCPDLYQPVTVTAMGVWEGDPVDYRRTYPNPCQLRRATSVLFAF